MGYRAQQLPLNQDAVVMVAIEYSDLAEFQAFLAGLQDFLADERGFFIGVLGGNDQRKHPVRPRGDEFLGIAGLIVGDRSTSEGDDLGRGTIVDIEMEDRRAGMPFGETEDIIIVRASEPVDRLCIVAHGREIPRPRGGDRLDHLDLHGIGILHLVDEDVLERLAVARSLLGKFAEQSAPLDEQVVVVHAIGRLFATGIGRRDRLQLGLPFDQLGSPLGDDIGQGLVHVRAEADPMLNGGGLRGHLACPGETGIIHGQPHQVELIFAIEDREIRLIAQARRRAPENPIADVMEGPGPDLISLSTDQRFELTDHLPRRASGERDEHDRTGRNSRGDQVGNTEGDDPRLARTGTGQDQVVAVRRRHRGMLRRIQLALKVLGQPGGQR